MTPTDKKLYDLVKIEISKKYKKNSAYRSGAIIKKYKELGGTFKEDNKPKKLKQWFKEDWKDVNPLKTFSSYPVYRPTKRINKSTPLTINEIDPFNLIEQSINKQKIKGNKNLKPFKIKSNFI
jgi:hypothetical protein